MDGSSEKRRPKKDRVKIILFIKTVNNEIIDDRDDWKIKASYVAIEHLVKHCVQERSDTIRIAAAKQ